MAMFWGAGMRACKSQVDFQALTKRVAMQQLSYMVFAGDVCR